MKTLKCMAALLVPVLIFSGCSALPSDTTPQVFDTGIDSDAWAAVPAGDFLKGQFSEEAEISYDYEIMITPVTNAQYAAYLNGALSAGTIEVDKGSVTGYYKGDDFHNYKHESEIAGGYYPYTDTGDADARLLFDGQKFSVKAGYENHPVTIVTWFGANAYCEFYGWRLPSEDEWEKAARGTDGRAYPWGDEIGHANANYYSSGDPFEEGIGAIGNTTPAGFYNGKTYDGYATLGSASPYGLYDTAGNVWEWTGNIYSGTHLRCLRGGGKADYAYDLRVWTRNSAHPASLSASIGFRAVRAATS